jgi:hypothetical protein
MEYRLDCIHFIDRSYKLPMIAIIIKQVKDISRIPGVHKFDVGFCQHHDKKTAPAVPVIRQ